MSETPTDRHVQPLSTEMAWYALHEPLKNFIRKRVTDRLGRLIDYQPRCHCCEPQTARVQASTVQWYEKVF
ncbi:hypothetical protein [Dictyobacter formicarum]|nr:hypothetical protein [Dictyobacter formicarum]